MTLPSGDFDDPNRAVMQRYWELRARDTLRELGKKGCLSWDTSRRLFERSAIRYAEEFQTWTSPMDRALVKGTMGTVPPGLVSLFNDPPLVGDEKREDYENLFSAIVAAIKPNDAVVWLLARDFADLSWEIRRERKLKLQIIKLAQLEWISKLLAPSRPSFLELPHLPPTTDQRAKLWAADAETRRSIDNKLAKQGFDASYIMTLALKQAAPQIEAIDRRIGTYELRRMAAIRAIEQYSETSARRLAASADVIEGQFTEAEEKG